MGYKFKTEEFELTLEEQEKAWFILDTVTKANAKEASGNSSGVSFIEYEAFKVFRSNFYFRVQARLHIYEPYVWSLSEDGKKVLHTVVVKE